MSGILSSIVGASYSIPFAGFYALNTLKDIDSWDSSWGYQTSYMGDDSNQNPVFSWVYKDASDNLIKIVSFRVDKTTGQLTIGTPASTGLAGYQSPSMVSENEHGNIRTRASNYGYIAYGVSNTGKVHAFSVDTSTLATTIGTVKDFSVYIDAGDIDVTYVGNSRIAVTVRGGGYVRTADLYSRSGTTLTLVKNFASTFARDNSYENGIGFENSGSNYRWIHYGGQNPNAGIDAPYMVAFHYYNSTGYTGSQTLSSAFGYTSGGGGSVRSNVINLNKSDKWLALHTVIGGSGFKALAGTINWGTGSPTFTNGTAVSLTPTDNEPLMLVPGANDDEAYVFYEASSTIRYRKLTVSGTAITEGVEVNTLLSSTNVVGNKSIGTIAKSQSGNYLVTVTDFANERTAKAVTANDNAQIDTAQSKFGGSSALFDGNGDYLQTPNSSDFYLNTGNWTAECWFRVSSLQWTGLFGQYNNGGSPGTGWAFLISGNGQIYFQSQSSNYDIYVSLLSGNNVYSINTWNHAAFVIENDVLSLYCNGNRVAQQNISGKRTLSNVTQAMKIGATRGLQSGGFGTADAFFNGWMDEMRFSNTVRYTGSTYTVPTTPFVNDANTVLLLHMDGADASTVFHDDAGGLYPKVLAVKV